MSKCPVCGEKRIVRQENIYGEKEYACPNCDKAVGDLELIFIHEDTEEEMKDDTDR